MIKISRTSKPGNDDKNPGIGYLMRSTAWAIDAANFAELQSLHEAHIQNPKLDIKSLEHRIGFSLARPLEPYRIDRGVAIIPIEGLLVPKGNLLTRCFGATSAQWVENQVKNAVSDNRVQSILLHVDCPGGSANGTPELAETVFYGAKQKPIVSFSDSLMLGAGYWVAAAANDVYLSGPSVHAGCIGISMAHVYRAGSNLITTQISAGHFKTIASEKSPLTDAGYSHIQSQVNHLYQVFTDDVANYRGASPAYVIKRMADGRTYIGKQAVDAGLADGIQSLEKLLTAMAANPARFGARRRVLAHRIPAAHI